MSINRLPNFIIIGAMKCATSTLHDQLARQPGLFMSEPKEPCFFSNDEVYARGLEWYTRLFVDAPPNSICGESSTHYTKLPTYSQTVERLYRHVPNAKLVYVMRDPVARLVSQYIHEWSERTVPGSIDLAVARCPRLIDYSRYSMQLQPFLETFGRENVLPVFFERLINEPQGELDRICAFIRYPGEARWHEDGDRRNISRQRLRNSALRDAMVWNPAVTWLRRRFIPQGWRDHVKRLWQMKRRPRLSSELLTRVEQRFDEDLAVLGEWLGIELTCKNFKEVVTVGPLEFAGCLSGSRV